VPGAGSARLGDTVNTHAVFDVGAPGQGDVGVLAVLGPGDHRQSRVDGAALGGVVGDRVAELLRGPDSGCELLPGFGRPAAKNVVCHGAAGRRAVLAATKSAASRSTVWTPIPTATVAAVPGWQRLRRAHDSEAATGYAVNPVNLSQKASHDRGPHLHHQPRIQSVRPADRHQGRRWAYGSSAAWPQRPRLDAGHRRMPVGYHARPAPFIPTGTAPGRE
jgi:hypothetical protein